MSSLRMVEYAQFKQALERLRVSVPSSIMESERTLQERDRILEAAEAEAARLVLQRDQSLVNQGVVARQELEASRARSLAADASARAAASAPASIHGSAPFPEVTTTRGVVR